MICLEISVFFSFSFGRKEVEKVSEDGKAIPPVTALTEGEFAPVSILKNLSVWHMPEK